MRNMRRTVLWCALGALAVAILPARAADKADPRVKAMLDKLALKYEVDDDHDYKLTFNFDDQRSQVCFINSDTETIGKMAIREVWAIAAIIKGPVPQETCEKLLQASRKYKLAAWEMDQEEDGDNRAIVLVAKVPVTADETTWKAAITMVAAEADEMEKVITEGKDDF